MKQSVRVLLTAGVFCVAVASMAADNGCSPAPAQSSSGLAQAQVTVQSGPDGLSAEQRNVRDRVVEDNKPGAIKHLYIISAYSGQVLVYSTVKGKVTSSGKRLDPASVSVGPDAGYNGYVLKDGHFTNEVLGADGTYGPSVEYLYWWDTNGVYHQQYVTGGMILHVSSQPLSVKGVVINMAVHDEK